MGDYPSRRRSGDRGVSKSHAAAMLAARMCASTMSSCKEMLVDCHELAEQPGNFALADENAIRTLPNIVMQGVTHLPITFTQKA